MIISIFIFYPLIKLPSRHLVVGFNNIPLSRDCIQNIPLQRNCVLPLSRDCVLYIPLSRDCVLYIPLSRECVLYIPLSRDCVLYIPLSRDCCPYCGRIGLLNILALTQIAARFNTNYALCGIKYISLTKKKYFFAFLSLKKQVYGTALFKERKQLGFQP